MTPKTHGRTRTIFGWTQSDWAAHLVYRLTEENTKACDGIFYGKRWTVGRKQSLARMIVLLVHRVFPFSKALRPRSGKFVLLGVEKHEIERSSRDRCWASPKSHLFCWQVQKRTISLFRSPTGKTSEATPDTNCSTVTYQHV